ncbi:50S ribosomal protein L1 [Alphaproteobacteria bacterium endosymbiont of Tiliacea citrago]|uniref:50S ribosomal protein L1 n=1 Tax=Alphaproteobacteria bacterium endosymbiont of Tiliacea citrago TaxID=3077944 RepID=UPI00313E8A71
MAELKKNCTLPKKLQNKHGKRFLNLYEKFERKIYNPLEAFNLLVNNVKKHESIDVVFILGIDPKKTDQVIKGVLKVVPNGLGKDVKVGVFTKTNIQDYLDNGATYAGFEDLISDIKSEKVDADVYIASKEIMPDLAKLGLGRVLKGKMPNPKLGTVVEEKDLVKAVKEQKAGQLTFRSQATLVQSNIGKASFSGIALYENYIALKNAIIAARPQVVKPHSYIKRIFISSTMSPSLQLEINENKDNKQ